MKAPQRWRTLALPACALLLAVWPLWRWYGAASADDSNDHAGLLALATAVVLAASARTRPALAAALMLPAALMTAYELSTWFGLAPALRAACALLALAALVSACLLGRRLDPALAALCLLALPVAASLQFYFGYPLRVVAGTMSAALLRMQGLAVVREGALLAWNGQLIAIDAPCSGFKMLWAGLYLACALGGASALTARRLLAAGVCATLAVVAANALRAAALFQTEAGLVPLPAWAHQSIGVVCFGAAALAILFCVLRLKRGTP